MYLIEKIVIKDGVNADTTVTINKYTGEVDAINTLLAHPNIPNTRGIATYSVVGNKPTFNFSGVGANEMWIYVNGVGFTPGGITSIAADTAIKVLPNSGSSTYTYTSGDNGKVLIVTDATNLSLIAATPLPINHSFFVLNNSDASFGIQAHAGSGTEFMLYTVEPNTFVNIYRSGLSVIVNPIAYPYSDYYNYAYTTSQVININQFIKVKNAALEMAFSGSKTVNVPGEWPTGKEISIINLATLGSISVVLPEGETTRSGYTYLTITPLSKKRLVKGSSGYWYGITENIE